MGIVYRAFDTRLQRAVAIKTLAASAPDARQSLLREARAASALNHSHICTIYEVGEHDGCPYIAMEYIHGRPLGELIPREGLPAESVMRYGTQVAEAVEHAHRHGIVHCDLKSANVLVSVESQAKVLDFGLASRLPAVDADTLTRTATGGMNQSPLAGTLLYLAPERLRGSAADARSDVWALGVLVYEMAAGRLPFHGANPFELTAAILEMSPAPLPDRIPMPLRAVIGRCLERDRAQRYQHAGEVRVALETLQFGSRPSPVAWTERLAARAGLGRSKRRGMMIAGTVALVLAVAGTIAVFQPSRAPALTERDTLVVADFVNTTGDSVFDLTLRQALSINLEQSPFLSVISREQVRDTLRLMTKPPDERVVGDVARNACQRLGAKAMIEGSIAPFGSHYSIGLNALNCQSGETIASDQVEVKSREEVLKALGSAASRLRRTLGESLPTIQRFDTPIEQATTPSLEALKAFSAGEDVRARSSEFGAVLFYKRAIELDPNFATAYARLASIYANLGQVAEQRRNIEEAYARREQVSQRERFYIEGMHCGFSTDPDACVNVFELWKGTYPRDGRAYGNLSGAYFGRGECERSVKNAAEAVRLDPTFPQPYGYLARAYLCLGQSAEAKRTLDQAFARHLGSFPFVTNVFFHVAFFDRDDGAMAMARQLAMGQPEESLFAELESEAAAFDGQMRRSRELRVRAEQLAADRLKDRIVSIRARGALYEAAQGDLTRARGIVKSIAADSPPAPALPFLTAAAVLSRDYPRADALFRRDEGSAKPVPSYRWQPFIHLLRDVDAGDRAALARLPPASTRDFGEGLPFLSVYVRGLIYLHAGDGPNAVAEFQRILDHRGRGSTSPLYPLAYVQQARAYALTGDRVKAGKAYQDFLGLWKAADADITILREARSEYARLVAA